jgi:hypothetical protein
LQSLAIGGVIVGYSAQYLIAFEYLQYAIITYRPYWLNKIIYTKWIGLCVVYPTAIAILIVLTKDWMNADFDLWYLLTHQVEFFTKVHSLFILLVVDIVILGIMS